MKHGSTIAGRISIQLHSDITQIIRLIWYKQRKMWNVAKIMSKSANETLIQPTSLKFQHSCCSLKKAHTIRLNYGPLCFCLLPLVASTRFLRAPLLNVVNFLELAMRHRRNTLILYYPSTMIVQIAQSINIEYRDSRSALARQCRVASHWNSTHQC